MSCFLPVMVNHTNIRYYHLGPVSSKGAPLNHILPCCTRISGQQFDHWDKWATAQEDPDLQLTFSWLGFVFGAVLSEYLQKRTGRAHQLGILQAGIGRSSIQIFASQWTIEQCYHKEEVKSSFSSGFNAMENPLKRHSIKGILWYQGKQK